MINLLPAPDNVLALRMTATVTAEDFDRVIAEIEAKLKRHPRIGLFVDMTNFDGLTAGAAVRDLRYSLGKFGQWRRFAREAIVTDKRWIRNLAKAAAPLVPQVEVKVFETSARDEALAWASAIAVD